MFPSVAATMLPIAPPTSRWASWARRQCGSLQHLRSVGQQQAEGDEVHVRDAVFEPGRDEGSDREDDGEDLVGHAPPEASHTADLLQVFFCPDARIREEVVRSIIQEILSLDPSVFRVDVAEGRVRLKGTVERRSLIPVFVLTPWGIYGR